MAATPEAAPPVVLVSWDGRDTPLRYVEPDAVPRFELVLFDYSGGDAPARLPAGLQATVLRQRTECKGELYAALAAHLAGRDVVPAFVALIDDDVLMPVSSIHRMLHLGHALGLHAFQAALAHDSQYTHRWTLQQTRRLARDVDWVEVMMPFYSGALFMALAPHLQGNISSWGIDRYLVPAVQQVLGCTRTAIVDAITAAHLRPVTSDQRTYRNGLTARQEAQLLRERAIELLRQRRPDLLGSAWFRRLYLQRHTRNRWQMLAYGLGRPLRRWLEQST